MMSSILKDQRGVALITAYITSVALVSITAAAFGTSFYEYKHVEREVDRTRSFAAAEAGVQSAVAQMGVQAYTGFINTNSITVSNFQSVSGTSVGSFDATLAYPNQADWVIVTASGAVGSDTRSVEARIFLQSNLSKYLVYADTSNFSSGTNAQYGSHDGINPEGVPSNEDDRAAMYFTGDWTTSGSNVQMYGDVHAEDEINGNSSSQVHGDTYVGDFSLLGSGAVSDDGVSGGLVVGDGFSDDIDRDSSGTVDSADEPDKHDLTVDGAGDSHAEEDLVQIDNSFYQNNNSIPSFGSSSGTRYLEFQSNSNGTSTDVIVYDGPDYQNQTGSYTLTGSDIVYVDGDIFVKGEIQGRVSVVSSDDIFFMDHVTYAGGQTHASASHSTAFMAQDTLFFLPENVEVSGILYAQSDGSSSTAFRADYTHNGSEFVYDPYSKDYLRLYGNRILNGGSNMGYYDDRIYGYDSNLKYYRPPGIPVYPELRTIREIDPSATP